ncbi:MAG: ATP-binding protein [Phycisphaerae bacterium]|nr:ATP-binding protein [Phycisphaerae bacterium]
MASLLRRNWWTLCTQVAGSPCVWLGARRKAVRLRSIQWTLQLWYAGVLAVVLVGFGSASYFGISRARWEQLDSELARSVQELAAGLRPPKTLESSSMPASTAGTAANVSRDLWKDSPPPDFELPVALAQRFALDDPASDYFVIWDGESRVLASSNALVAAGVPYPGARPDQSVRPHPPGPPQIRKRGEFREAYMNGPRWTRILVGTSVRPTEVELRHFAFLLTAIGAGVLAAGLVGGWLVSLRAVRPIRAITEVAQEISASNLSRRIPVAEVQSELGSLAVVLNEMFGRLEAAFQQQVRFTADASHELRTPLSVIHTHVQLALSRERTADEYRKTIETCQRASSRMKDLVDSLLLLAGADAGRLALNRQRADLREVVENSISMVSPLAEAKSVIVQTDLRPAELSVDLSRIAQVTTNLLTNAIRYNRKGGRVEVRLGVDGPDVVLAISDTGLGIPLENQPHIFERFYRVDKARSREEGGSGLGLAICKTIVEAHGGTISFRSKPGQGTTFEVRLPLTETRMAKSL